MSIYRREVTILVIQIHKLFFCLYLKINNITSIDYLKMDVEGHETDIIEAYDWSVLPTYIKMEHSHINDINMKNILEGQGYIVSVERRDLYAVR